MNLNSINGMVLEAALLLLTENVTVTPESVATRLKEEGEQIGSNICDTSLRLLHREGYLNQKGSTYESGDFTKTIASLARGNGGENLTKGQKK